MRLGTHVLYLSRAEVASLGLSGISDSGFFAALLCAGFFVIGGHQGLNSTVGLFYPSANRSTAVGWALPIVSVPPSWRTRSFMPSKPNP